LLISIVLSIAVLIYIVTNPRQAESFTEFYILGPKGKASDYPTKLFVGQNGSVIIGIVNHEQRTVNYTVVIWLARMENESIGNLFFLDSFSVTLEHKPLSEKWEKQWEKLYNFSIERPGKYKMFFLLFKDGVPFKAERMRDYAGTEAEEMIGDAIEGRIQSLILNIEVSELFG
jgi:uncharacterized membrane protein